MNLIGYMKAAKEILQQSYQICVLWMENIGYAQAIKKCKEVNPS